MQSKFGELIEFLKVISELEKYGKLKANPDTLSKIIEQTILHYNTFHMIQPPNNQDVPKQPNPPKERTVQGNNNKDKKK